MRPALRGLGEALKDLRAGALDAYREGREDHRNQFYAARKEKDLDDTDAPRWQFTTGTNPSFYRTRELLKQADPINQQVRSELGMDLRGSRAHKIGQVLGTLGADITQDTSRSLWWLLNAPQATADVVLEQALARSQPELYRTVNTHIPDDARHFRQAADAGLIDYESGRLQKGVTRKQGRYHRRSYHPGTVAALGIPTGVAINAGTGLFQNIPGLDQLSAFEGYEAAVPDANDRSETANAVAEVGAKYLLGRTGNLLGYDDGFALQRPDVSRGEYGAYKAFKYDKAIDLNPFDDGEVTLPAGVAKATADGIHGPELQFLGRSLCRLPPLGCHSLVRLPELHWVPVTGAARRELASSVG